VKRKGFTLIELMVVIAIIIILAAIAIPNYLKMTERAKRSRLASDYATLATVLETFKTDWGKYPIDAAGIVKTDTENVHIELSGLGQAAAAGAVFNGFGATNAVGEKNPDSGLCIEYIKTGTLTSMTNPFDASMDILYTSDGDNWVVYTNIGGATANYLYRTDGMSTVSESGTTTPSY
jgi:prepilin-type N-terminal cleavage/methylation domain-containing protein